MKNITSEIRKDYFLDKYVIITPSRSKRPREIKEQTTLTRNLPCPFCPENIKNKKILEKIELSDREKVVSLANMYPAVSLKNKKSFGVQEVIIETTSHTKELAELSKEQIKAVLRMYAQRTKNISKIKNIEYILCFKNQGAKAGASIVHAHSQVFATNIQPPDIREELNRASAYVAAHNSCPYCDIIKKESRSERKIFNDKNIIAFAPYASQYHYEAWIFTRRHLDNITLLNDSELESLAKILKKILLKIHSIDLPFNLFLHQVISNNSQHFCLKIQPRGSVWAGVEIGSGMVINSIAPEQAAKFYRAKN
jgi:UDPglucose--hexose-1-phosphate uridylyltransferase